MQGPYLRKYGVETTINFVLYEVDGINFRVDAADGGSDCSIMKDEGAEATCTNDFTDEGTGYSLVLTATEMEAARIVVYVIDSATKVWLDESIIIETYGNASAMHAVDLDDSVRAGLTALPNAGADAAGGLSISDAGGLDLDAKLAETNEITAARMGALTDWLNGGRLDLLLDAIPTTAMRGTDNAATEAKQDIIDTNVDQIETAVITNAAGTDIAADIIAVKAETVLIVADTNELQTDWADGGRLDLILDTCAAGGDPWATAIPGAYGAGTAGKILGDNINAPLATIDTVVDGIVTDVAAVKAETVLIVADTNELQTDNIPGTLSTIDGKIDTIDTNVDSILIDTGITLDILIKDIPTNTELAAAFTEIKGATWASGTDTLEHIRDKQTDIEIDTAEIGVAGAGLTNINLPNQTMDIIGDITGNLSGSVGSVTTVSDKTGYALSASGIDAVHDEEVDNDGTAISSRGALKLLLSVFTGKDSGGGTPTLVFRDIADTKNRLSVTVDANGNRTAVGTRDAT